MRFPQTFVDDLKSRADIVQVAQSYMKLTKKGANWMACCPFHKEKTPSFSVNPAKGIFYCFGCHKGGSVFNFVMEMEGASFPESIKIVAQKVGVSLPELIEDKKFQAKRIESEDVIELNKWAMEWWSSQLSSGRSRVASDYVASRGLTPETIKTFGIGYAPDSWDGLLTVLKQKGAAQYQIERSGLIVKKDETKFYDRFRDRLMFTVMDVQGRPIAFGGRTLKNEDAKYINSPETAAYIKGHNLFGLNLTRGEIRRQGFAILVEGFIDLIIPYQFGIRNIVASLGTAFTQEQARLIGKSSHKVVLNYDGDNAGIQAAQKALTILLAENIEVKVLTLPGGLDPDEFIRNNGVAEYHKQRSHAQSHIQFILGQAVKNRQLSNPADKEAAINEILPYIRAVNSRIQQREYFDLAVESLRITNAETRKELWISVRSEGKEVAPAVVTNQRVASIQLSGLEENFLRIVLADNKVRAALLPQLELEDYEDLVSRPLIQVLVDATQDDLIIDYGFLKSQLYDDPVSLFLPELLIRDKSELGTDEARMEIATRCLSLIKRNSCANQMRGLLTQMREYESRRQDVSELATRYNELMGRMTQLDGKATAEVIPL